MPLNPFFLQGSKTEQGLIQDLINEQLRMYGVEVHYMPRKYITEKTVIREVIESEFNESHPIEAYVENYEGYGDQTTILSKFGIQSTQEITLTISKERFDDYISPLLKSKSNSKLSSRPKEGDLVYFPLGDRLFEIKFVEHEKPFYQLQKGYVYTLKCELFRYENEVIDTGVDEIDDTLQGTLGDSGAAELLGGDAMTTTLKLSNSLKSNKDLSYRILAQIASSVPSRVKFDQVEYDGKKLVSITGIAAGDNDILQLIRNLQSKKLITQASLSSMKMPRVKAGDQTMKGFKVFVKIKG